MRILAIFTYIDVQYTSIEAASQFHSSFFVFTLSTKLIAYSTKHVKVISKYIQTGQKRNKLNLCEALKFSVKFPLCELRRKWKEKKREGKRKKLTTKDENFSLNRCEDFLTRYRYRPTHAPTNITKDALLFSKRIFSRCLFLWQCTCRCCLFYEHILKNSEKEHLD